MLLDGVSYPAGHYLLASELAGIVSAIQDMTLYVEKTADTSRASTTSRTADPHLTLPVKANATYEMSGLLVYGAGGAASTNGFDFGFTAPSGATLEWESNAKIDTDGSNSAAAKWFVHRVLADSIFTGGAGGNTNKLNATPQGRLKTSSTAGNLVVVWAQHTSSATATILYTGSHLRLRRVA